jgi:flagellar protein FliL
MVANRMDSTKEAGSRIEKPSAPATPPAAVGGGGFKAWLPLLVTILVMPAVAYGLTTLVLLPKLQSGLGLATTVSSGAAKDAKPGKEGETKKETATMGKLLVNVAGSMGSRYLMISLTLVGSGADFKAKIDRNDPQLRDAAGSVLSAKTLPDLERPGARNLIRSELISAFNHVLGASTVQEIYLTEFAVQ